MTIRTKSRTRLALAGVFISVAGALASSGTAAAATDPQYLPGLATCTEVMGVGSHGACVEALQYSLQVAGLNVKQDGSYGPQTRGAVLAFQAQLGLGQDGVAGPQTIAALDRAANAPEPDRSFGGCPQLTVGVVDGCVWRFRQEFSAVDQSVNDDSTGYNVYTVGLAAAVRSYQVRNGLVVDGVVGRQTADLVDVQAGPTKVCIATGGDSLNADGSCPHAGAVPMGKSAWDCLQEATLGLPKDLVAEHYRDEWERTNVMPKSEALHFLMRWYTPVEVFGCISFG